jgi:hypothetical protein
VGSRGAATRRRAGCARASSGRSWMRSSGDLSAAYECAGADGGMVGAGSPNRSAARRTCQRMPRRASGVVRHLARTERRSAQSCADPAKGRPAAAERQTAHELLAPHVKQHDPRRSARHADPERGGSPSGPTRSSTRGCRCTPGFHTGVQLGGGAQPSAAAGQLPAGVHHYPTPIADIQLVT